MGDVASPGRRPQAMARACLLFAACLLAGCAADRPDERHDDTPLQDPLPGQAIVYLLRAPHDGARVEVAVNGRRAATLPPGTYTAITLAPGRHAIVTSTTDGARQVAPPLQVDIAAGTRRFFNLSGVTSEAVTLQGVLALDRSAIPLLEPSLTTRAGRSWKEVTELDAQGLMSIARPVLPEQGAL
jgi:hypothetical protein